MPALQWLSDLGKVQVSTDKAIDSPCVLVDRTALLCTPHRLQDARATLEIASVDSFEGTVSLGKFR